MNKNSVNYDRKLNEDKNKKDRLRLKKNKGLKKSRGLKKNCFKLKKMNYVELRMKCGLKLRDNDLKKSKLKHSKRKKSLIKKIVNYQMNRERTRKLEQELLRKQK